MNKIFSILIVLLIVSCSGSKKKEQKSAEKKASELNIYSHRHYDSDKKAFKMFEDETGIKVNVVKAGADELISRMEMEGENSPADLLITVDAAKIQRAKDKGLLQPVVIPTNNQDGFYDTDGFWYALTYRARVIVFDKEKVNPEEIKNYADIADAKWKKKLLIRSSTSGYNQSLLAYLINKDGKEVATKWAKGVVENMAREPKGGDRDQIKAIAAGLGDIAVVNTYYLGLLLNSENPEEVKVGEAVGVIFPNQEDKGTHINISGIAIPKNAPNLENAKKFIQFMTGEKIQKFYASNSFEYPVNKNVSPDSTVAEWGSFKAADLEFAKKPQLNKEAIAIFENVGWL